MDINCPKCDKLLVMFDGFDSLVSASLRCRCGTRVHIVDGEVRDVTKHVVFTDIDEVRRIANDSSLTPLDKADKLGDLVSLATNKRRANEVMFGKVIHAASTAQSELNLLAAQQATDLYGAPAEVDWEKVRAYYNKTDG